MKRQPILSCLGLFLVLAFLAPGLTKAQNRSVTFPHATSGTSTIALHPRPNGAFECLPIRKATLHMLLNWGGDIPCTGTSINTGAASYVATVSVKLYDQYTSGGTLLDTYTQTLRIDPSTPQSYTYMDIPSATYVSTNRMEVSVSVTATNPSALHLVTSKVYFVPEFEYDPNWNGPNSMTINPATPVVGTVLNNRVKFSWNPLVCVHAPNYQLQVLRLYNTSLANITTESVIFTHLDWSKALSIETGNNQDNIELTLTEGTGYYLWRVRAIGDKYDGGIADDRNWGPWSSNGTYQEGFSYTINAADPANGLFFFQQFDEDRNWIYGRTFLEGDVATQGQTTIGESMQYANGLLMSTQAQTRVASEQKLLLTQNLYDYAGRASLVTLPAGLNNSQLGYVAKYVRRQDGNSYTATDFDDSDPGHNTLVNPTPMIDVSSSLFANGPGFYYSSNNLDVPGVPSSEGFPFSRNIYSNDGLGRVKEESGPGNTHRMGAGHTSRTKYSAVGDMELIRVFGDEAPSEKSVYKELTIDPNGSRSVAYYSKEGQTIASCISSPPPSNLDPIPGVPDFGVTKDLIGYSPYGTNGFISFTNFSFTERTPIALNYDITPDVYKDLCAKICASCDYTIKIKLINLENPTTSIFSYTKEIPAVRDLTDPNSCVPGPIVSITKLDTLPEGDYYVERIIQANAPANDPNNYANAFEESLDLMKQNLLNNLNNGAAKLVDYNGNVISSSNITLAEIRTRLASGNLEWFYEYLGVEDRAHNYRDIEVDGCERLRIPIWFCPSASCGGSDGKLEEFLYTQWGPTYGTSLGDYSSFLKNLDDNQVYSGDFNNMVQHMVNDGGYECDEVWACWRNCVQSYQTLTQLANNLSLPPGTTLPTPPIDIVKMFLGCMNYRMDMINFTPYGQSGYISEGYHVFYYDDDPTTRNISCENAFCAEVAGITGINCPPTAGTVTDFVTFYNTPSNDSSFWGSLSPTQIQQLDAAKHNFYLCFKNSTLTGTTSDPDVYTTANNIQQTCEQFCEDKFNAFVSEVTLAEHDAGNYIEGDLFVLVTDPQTGVTAPGPTTIAEYTSTHGEPPPGITVTQHDIYCLAMSMENTCKHMCDIAVLNGGQGGVASNEAIRNVQNILSKTFSIKLANEGNCAEGYTPAGSQTSATDNGAVILHYLENQLSAYKANAPQVGDYWDWIRPLQSFVSPKQYDDIMKNCRQLFVHPDIPSYFGVTEAGVCDGLTYYFNKSLPGSTQSPKDIYSLLPNLPNVISSNIHMVNVASLTPAELANAYVPTDNFDLIPGAGEHITPLLSLIGFDPNYTSEMKIYKYDNAYWEKEIECFALCDDGERTCSGICYKLSDPQIDPDDITTYTPITCAQQTMTDIDNGINMAINILLQNHEDLFKAQYKTKCLDNINEHFTLTYKLNYKQYTLYYYDRAGNLVKTVPPAGVTTSTTNRLTHPGHTQVTEYDYNSLKSPLRKKTPNGGETKFWYDDLNRIRFSQNAQQIVTNLFSYTKYDELSRMIEIGEMANANLAQVNTLNYPSTQGTQVTKTIYSQPAGLSYFGGEYQRFLQNRVSYIVSDPDPNTPNDNITTYYSYDAHGNVDWMVQHIPELGPNYIAYEYDQISGSVRKVKYNELFTDRFSHRYTYDADKRIKTVETSRDNYFWEKDASYNYALHGPLQRSVIGHDQVQGLDYTYTIQGWLKAINHNSLNSTNDPGKDGSLINPYIPQDAFGMTLGYFNGDYTYRTSSLNSSTANAYHLPAQSGKDLYNGNISSQTSNIAGTGASTNIYEQLTGSTYRYDELNRLVDVNFSYHQGGVWNATTNFDETFEYDANGNIHSAKRYATAANRMDDISYSYAASGPDQLSSVNDAFGNALVNQDFPSGSTSYGYDNIGNLTNDGTNVITWNLYGKVSQVTFGNQKMKFAYDANGHRVRKEYWNDITRPAPEYVDYYIVDNDGNTMATYRRNDDYLGGNNVESTYYLMEEPIYGASRLGQRTEYSGLQLDVVQYTIGSTLPNHTGDHIYTGDLPQLYRTLDHRQYELKDHLGNVRAAICDFKIPTTGDAGQRSFNFDDGTLQGWSGGTAAWSNNRMSISSVNTSTATITVSGLTPNTNYVVGFDLEVLPTCIAAISISNNNGLYGRFTSSGRKQLVFNSGTTGSVVLGVNMVSAPSGPTSFAYFDNILVKKQGNSTQAPVRIVDDNYMTTAGNWDNEGTNVAISYPSTGMEFNVTGTAGVSEFASKDFQVIPGMTYRANITFAATGGWTGIQTNDQIQFGMLNANDPAWLDQGRRVPNNSLTYTFDFIPNDNVVSCYFVFTAGGNHNYTIAVTKFSIDQQDNQATSLYAAKVNSYYNYYAFGGLQPQRFDQTGAVYPYGFNGQQKDDKISGDGNLNTAQFWEYDTRLGRRWNVDPKPSESMSPYACFSNNPIWFSDPYGDTVRYEKFRDKVNAFFARLFSKSFRASFNAMDNSPQDYTFRKRKDMPTLFEGGKVNRTGQNSLDFLYGSLGLPEISSQPVNINIRFGRWMVQKKVNDVQDWPTPHKKTLKRLVPNQPINMNAKGYPDNFTIVDPNAPGAPATVYNQNVVAQQSATNPDQNIGVVGTGTYTVQPGQTQLQMTVSSQPTWPTANGTTRSERTSIWSYTYWKYRGVSVNFTIPVIK